jgi:hypothetical protein
MLADRIIEFLTGLEFNGMLPPGIKIMNPYRDNPQILPVISQFYHRFYDDNNPRHIILGINPGRFGAGVTGIPFTDSKRLTEKCGLSIAGLKTFEPSSVFVYEMIDAFAGVEKFYNRFFISAVCPLGFTSAGSNNKHINYNYYDDKSLKDSMMDFISENLFRQLDFGIVTDTCFCLGTGKNYKFLIDLNNKLRLFGKIVPLEHPRYIMQYKSKQKQFYIAKYLEEFNNIIIGK